MAQQTIAIAQHKGGEGKTATAVALAATLTELERRVLLIDLDPQGNASFHLGLKHPDSEHTSAGKVLGGMSPANATVVHPAFGFDVLRGGKRTEVIGSMLEAHSELIGSLDAALREANRWDVVLLDCPPSAGRITQAALRAADHVLAPLTLDPFGLEGFTSLLSTIEAQREHRPSLALSGWFVSRADLREKVQQHALEVARAIAPPGSELRTMVRKSVRIKEAPAWRQPITLHDPKGPGAEDYRALARELLERGIA